LKSGISFISLLHAALCFSFTLLFIPYSSAPASRDLICSPTFWITKKCTHTAYFKHTVHIMKENYMPKNPSPFKTTNLFWKSDRLLLLVLTNSVEHNPSSLICIFWITYKISLAFLSYTCISHI